MLSEEARSLLSFLSVKDKEKREDSLKPKVNLKTSVGMFAFVYEKARNFIDYQEEHLLLRRAITRILIRRIKSNNNPNYLINSLVTELLMARYLPDGYLSEDKLPLLEKILAKYLLLYSNLGQRKMDKKESFLDFLLSLAAREIEEILVPSYEDQLLNFTLVTIEKRVVWLNLWSKEGKEITEEERRARLLVALMRTLSKYEDRTIYFKLWKIYFPFWSNADQGRVLQVAKKFSEADRIIDNYLKEDAGEPLVRILKKQVAPYEILRDLISRGYPEVEEIFSSSEKMTKAAFAAVNYRYHRALSLLKRSAINSFVYIFITKMVFALALEIPYELYLSSKINYLPVSVNLLFPPGLMLFMALTVELPTESNTQKIIADISSIIFGDHGLDQIKIDLSDKKSVFLTNVFRGLYALAFLLTFGLTVFFLRKLHFSVVSLGIFFFFLSTISFFAFRIRFSFKELVVGEENQNFVSTVFDFFMLPFIKLGRVISSSLQDMNIFIFIFDILIEAPFKLILEIVEEWIKFLREKKEQALNVIS